MPKTKHIQGSITVACNRIELLKKSMDDDNKLSCISNHFNIILTIYHNPHNPPPSGPGTTSKVNNNIILAPWICGNT